MSAKGVIFLDTETTGLDPERHSVWEVAWILDGKEFVYHPDVDLRDAAPDALRLTNYYERSLTFGTDDLVLVARELALATAGRHLVGAVPSFDAAFLSLFLRRQRLMPAWHYHLVDVEALAAGKLGIGPPWNSDELSQAIGVDPNRFDRHTALGDARWAKAIFEAVVGT